MLRTHFIVYLHSIFAWMSKKSLLKTSAMGYFKVTFTEANMTAFCNEYKLKALNKESTCFKNCMSPSCTDLFLKNSQKSFEITLTIEIRLSVFHKLIVTVLKLNHEKVPPKIVQYRDYKIFWFDKIFWKTSSEAHSRRYQ